MEYINATENENLDYVASELIGLARLIASKDPDLKNPEYGFEFKNDVFEMHPYCFDPVCDCGAYEKNEKNLLALVHSGICKARRNFKCGNIEISWYKYIGRSMEIIPKVSRKELRSMFTKCFDSLE